MQPNARARDYHILCYYTHELRAYTRLIYRVDSRGIICDACVIRILIAFNTQRIVASQTLGFRFGWLEFHIYMFLSFSFICGGGGGRSYMFIWNQIRNITAWRTGFLSYAQHVLNLRNWRDENGWVLYFCVMHTFMCVVLLCTYLIGIVEN